MPSISDGSDNTSVLANGRNGKNSAVYSIDKVEVTYNVLKVKIDGEWTGGDIKAKVNGEWVTPDAISIKVDGGWIDITR